MRKRSTRGVRASAPSDAEPNAWLLGPFFALLGLGQLGVGVRYLVMGEVLIQEIDQAGNIVSEQILVGSEAVACVLMLACGGAACLMLGFLGPRARDAKAKRGSYLALPPLQSRLLVASLIGFIASLLSMIVFI